MNYFLKKGTEVKHSSLLHSKAVKNTAIQRRKSLIDELSIVIMRERGISIDNNNPKYYAIKCVIGDLLHNGAIEVIEQHKGSVSMDENSENADVMSVVAEIFDVYVKILNNRRF